MLYLRLIRIALINLINHKLRTFLSILGLIIGVGSVISMFSLGNGAKHQMAEQMKNIGTNLIIVRAGSRSFRGVRSSTSETLKIEDAKAILNKAHNISMVSPVVTGRIQAKYLSKNTNTSLIGTTPTYFKVRNFIVEKGSEFTDAHAFSKVVIIGAKVKEDLAENENIIGKKIKINGIDYLVLGVLKAKGDQGWYNPDDQVIIPIDVAMKQVIGQDYLREIDIMIDDLKQMDETIVEIEDILRKQHKIRDKKDDDFHIRNVAEMVETTKTMANTFTFLLAGVASISLIVGGIGIMNIMLVTVTERTKEIGIRKALGAKEKDILFQFLIEAVLISIVGGIIGIFSGIGISYIADNFLPFVTKISSLSIIISFIFSSVVGIFFGFYPAYKAAKLDPIGALRYE